MLHVRAPLHQERGRVIAQVAVLFGQKGAAQPT